MIALRTIKRALLPSNDSVLSRTIARSNWRRQRLLILCYHGIAMGEEHGSHPEMFMPVDVFARRMEILAQSGATVLKLGEALRLLRQGELPPESVTITFDDGWADFRTQALPVLQKHGFPATVYLTTYYCRFSRPIFRYALAFMMWKLREQAVENVAFDYLPPQLHFHTEASRSELVWKIDAYAKAHELTGKQKDELAAAFAEAIGFDYLAFCRSRMFQLMTPEEVTDLAHAGIDFQLHTHRHRTPLDRDRFLAEIQENRSFIEEMTGANDRVHFCYPSGAVREEWFSWLQEAGVRSATSCFNGLATRKGNVYMLPRLLDQYALVEDEFASWVAGLGVFFPKRKDVPLDVAPE